MKSGCPVIRYSGYEAPLSEELLKKVRAEDGQVENLVKHFPGCFGL